MSIPSDLLSQFIKVTNDNKKQKQETTVYGTTKVVDGVAYVKIDGSDIYTPVSSTVDVVGDERVTVMVKDHTATVTGNKTFPAARAESVNNVASQVEEFENVMAHSVTADNVTAINAIFETLIAKSANISDFTAVAAMIETLRAKFIEGDKLSAKEIEAILAEFETLRAKFGEFTDLSTEDFEAINAEIDNLKGYTADFTYVSTDKLTAVQAEIKDLDAKKLSAEDAEIKYANIDFANIGKAAFEYLYSKSGLIENINVGDGSITGVLVGVTIKGDMIEGNTIVADKLVIKGEDGLYYKLNTQGVSDNDWVRKYDRGNAITAPEGDIELVTEAYTSDGYQVYTYTNADGDVAYCTIVDDVYYSVSVESPGTKYVIGDEIDAVGDETEAYQIGVTDDGDPIYTYTDESGRNAYFTVSDSGVYYEVFAESTGLKLEQTNHNSLNGSIITAKSITATQISVKDLVAFDATIGGFNITHDSIYSEVKDSNDNATRGIYFDTAGQVNIGDATNYIRYLDNGDGTFSLTISASDILYSLDGAPRSLSELGLIGEYVKIGTYDDEPCIELGESDSDFKLLITNKRILFMEGSYTPAYVNNQSLHIKTAVIEDEMRIGQFVWQHRPNGNMGLIWQDSTTEVTE